MSETFNNLPIHGNEDEQFCSWIMQNFGERVESITRTVVAGNANITTRVSFSDHDIEDVPQ